MCGITGWVDFGRDLRAERPAIEAMTLTMVNRGPARGEAALLRTAAGRRAVRLRAEGDPGAPRDPQLPGFMSIRPSSTSSVGFLLDINRWLDRSGVTIV